MMGRMALHFQHHYGNKMNVENIFFQKNLNVLLFHLSQTRFCFVALLGCFRSEQVFQA